MSKPVLLRANPISTRQPPTTRRVTFDVEGYVEMSRGNEVSMKANGTAAVYSTLVTHGSTDSAFEAREDILAGDFIIDGKPVDKKGLPILSYLVEDGCICILVRLPSPPGENLRIGRIRTDFRHGGAGLPF